MTNKDYTIINIHNDPYLLQLIEDTIPYLPGWKISNNAIGSEQQTTTWKDYINKTPSYFAFNVRAKYFCWFAEDNNIDNTRTIYIKNIGHLSRFLDKIYEISVLKKILKDLR